MSLPGILARIAEVAGESAALRLAQAAGGTVMTFSARPNSALARIVGAEAAKAIRAEFGPEKYTIPMAHVRGQKGRRVAATEMLARGATANAAARACDIHVRTAERLQGRIKRSREEGLPLFPDD